MSGQNINTRVHLGGKKNSINLYNNSKLDRFISPHNKGVVNTKTTISELISNKKNQNDPNPLKAREEGFNVYIMGANEERVKNMRKKEQLDKNSKRVSNSRSIARKNWEANNLISGGGLTSKNHILGNNAFRLLEKELDKKESRSLSKNLDLKSAGKEIRALLEKDNNIQISHNNYSSAYIKKSIQNHKITAHTRESIANIQSVLNNINAMNKNVSNNLKKLNVLESPLSNNGGQTKRFRNYEDAQFSIAIPNLISSAENPNEGLKVKEKTVEKESENRINNNLNIEADILDHDILELNEKISSDIINLNNDYTNVISEKDLLISDLKTKEKLPVSSMANNIKISNNSINCNNSNISLINTFGNNQNSLKTSNISLKKSKVMTVDNQNVANTDMINEFRNSSINTKDIIKRDNSNMIIHNFINKELNNYNNFNKSNNEPFPKKDIWNNKTLNTTNNLISKNQQRESYLYNKNLDESQDKTDDLTYVLSKVGSSLSPKKKILSAFPSKTRTKSSNKSKNPNKERPFSSILNLLKPRNLNKKNTIYENKSNTGAKTSSTTTISTINIRNNNNNNNITSIDTKGNKLNLIPSIQFIYKSPQNKLINQRTLSDLHKAQRSMRKNSIDTHQAMNIVTNLNLEKLITTRDNRNSINNNDKTEYFSNSSNKNITIENNNKFYNKHLSTKILNQEGNKIIQSNSNNNFKKNSQILKHFAPILTNNGNNSNNNQQQINKLPSLSNNNSSSNSNSTSNYQAIGTFNNNQSKNKIEILSKIDKLDEKKLSKLAKVVEELANHSAEMSQLSLNDSKKFKDSSTSKYSQNVIFRNMTEKYNINYINADSVNFGNININIGSKKDANNGNIKVDKILTDRTNFDSFKTSNEIKTFDEFVNNEYISPKFENEKKINFDEYPNDNQSKNLFSPSKSISENENKNKEGNFNVYNSNSSNNTIQRGNIFKNSIKSFLNHSFKPSLNTNTNISNLSVISLTIYSNWGNKDKIGLTEIQLFDNQNRQLEIVDCQVKNASAEGINRIFNNKFYTTDENDMWITNYLERRENLISIQLFHRSESPIDKMVIWNYNGKDLGKGLKEIKIETDNSNDGNNNFLRIHWRGNINKGTFSNKYNYSTKIKLSNSTEQIRDNDFFSRSAKSNKNIIIPDENFEIEEIKYEMTSPHDHLGISNKLNRKTNSKILAEELLDSLNIAHSKLQELKENPNTNILRNSLNINPNKTSFDHTMKSEVSNTHNSARNNNFNSFRNINNKNININNSNDNFDASALRTSLGKNGLNDFKKILLNKEDEAKSRNTKGIVCNRIKLILSSNYGDKDYIGLTGLQFLNSENKHINIEDAKSIGALPKDINTVYENCGDPRIFENVFNEINEVNDDANMWLTPFNPFTPPFLELEFESPIYLSAIKFWNYNRPSQLERGTRTIQIVFDEDYNNSKTVILRKGIGENGVDYSHIIYYPFDSHIFSAEDLELFQNIKPAMWNYLQDYETPYLPTGLVYKFVLHSTWGEENEIGLGGIEFYDHNGNSILDNMDNDNSNYITPKIIAIPCHENNNEIEGDFNTKSVGNLIRNRRNSQYPNEIETKWLGPFNNTRIMSSEEDMQLKNTFSNFNKKYGKINTMDNNKPNCLFFLFDRPISISYFKFRNYYESSTKGSKGCRDIDIYCDDNLIFKGNLKQVADEYENSTVILFTSDDRITKNIDKRLLNTNTDNKYAFKNFDGNKCYIMTLVEEKSIETQT